MSQTFNYYLLKKIEKPLVDPFAIQNPASIIELNSCLKGIIYYNSFVIIVHYNYYNLVLNLHGEIIARYYIYCNFGLILKNILYGKTVDMLIFTTYLTEPEFSSLTEIEKFF